MIHKIKPKHFHNSKNQLLLLLLYSVCCFCFYHCAQEESNQVDTKTVILEENQATEILATTIGTTSKLSTDTTANTNTNLANLPAKDAEIQEERIQNAKQNIDTSRVVKEFGKDCTAILAKYTKVINKFAESGDESVLDEILVWQNDLMFIYCTKQETHKVAFQKLNEILE
mgnify:CR=1 FL=1